MNISNISNIPCTGNTKQSKTISDTGYSFTQIMERIYNTRTSADTDKTDAEKRAAEVRAGLDAETLGYLEKYEEIYNKYAAQYGDGFEMKGLLSNGLDQTALAESKRYADIRDAFRTELYEAGIPGELGLRSVKAADFDGVSLNELVNNLKVAEPSYISTLFYAEKYGLAGLSKEEQCKAVMNGLQTGTADDFRSAISLLSKIGAISANDALNLNRSICFSSIPGEEISLNSILEKIKENDNLKDIYELLSASCEAQENNAEDEKLQALYKKIDAYQKTIHEAIEYRNQKQREQELLNRAAAESARLKVLFGLNNLSDITAADMDFETTVSGVFI